MKAYFLERLGEEGGVRKYVGWCLIVCALGVVLFDIYCRIYC